MTGHQAFRGDLLATLWVAVALGFYVVSLAVTVPGFGSPRAVAALLFVAGSFAYGAAADTAETTRHGVTLPVVAALRAAGVGVLILGAAAVVTGSEFVLAAFAAGIGVMWLATTTRHLFTSATPQAAPQTQDSAANPSTVRALQRLR